MHDKKRKKQSEAKKKNYREKMNPLLCVLEDLDYYIMLLMAGRDRGAGGGGAARRDGRSACLLEEQSRVFLS